MRNIPLLSLGLPLCLALLAGCSRLPRPTADAEEQWQKAMEGLQLWSIYPPSEDVMVGDVFLSVPGERDTLDAVRITSAPANLVAEQFCWQEEARFSLDTIQRSAVKDDKGNETQPAVNAGESGRSIGCERTARAGNRTASRQEERRIQRDRKSVV